MKEDDGYEPIGSSGDLQKDIARRKKAAEEERLTQETNLQEPLPEPGQQDDQAQKLTRKEQRAQDRKDAAEQTAYIEAQTMPDKENTYEEGK